MELKGKQLSLGAKLGAIFFVLLCFVVMIVCKVAIPIDDALKVGIFIALVFSPVDVSLWIEKFFVRRDSDNLPQANAMQNEQEQQI